MKTTIYLACLALAFGCSKSPQNETSHIKADEDLSINLTNAFAYATNIDNNAMNSTSYDTVVTNSDSIERKMIMHLSGIYGSEINQVYYDNKDNLKPDLSNYENLSDLSLHELHEDNTEEFVEKNLCIYKNKPNTYTNPEVNFFCHAKQC